jgi:hypothetical protein
MAVPPGSVSHLGRSSIEFLRGRGHVVELASYDDRLIVAAKALGVPIAPL